ncbi:MAG: glycerol-3-phosphate 1-O-acyltransferase PlsY [Lachnospiraceae bacterium]|nr:glycerol-3-phosphate 1-O-acyltransferase PlsY [Lachnospiraceae bacterium]
MLRLLFIPIGYIFGLFQTGHFYGKMVGRDLHKEGSGNTGATNALRVLGLKGGLIVFFFDVLKTFIPCFAVKMIFRDDPLCYVYLMYTAIGVVLGNDYPFYLKFKGGKGVAACFGWFLALDWRIAVIGISLFFIIAFSTRYVSISSICAALFVIILVPVFRHFGWLPIQEHFTELMILICVAQAILVFRHKDNIKRLINGNENRFGKKKTEEPAKEPETEPAKEAENEEESEPEKESETETI